MLSLIRKYRKKIATNRVHQNKLGQGGVDFLNQLRVKKPDELIVFKPKGYVAPIYLRAGTSDIPTFYQCIYHAEYDLNLAKEPQVIIDLGANIGLTSVFFKTKYPNAKVIAVEPEQFNFELLKKNTASFNNMILYHSGIWNKSTYLEVIDTGQGHYGFIVKETDID